MSTGGVGNAVLPVMPSRMASRRFSRSVSGNLVKLRRGLIFFTCSVVFVLICFLQIESCDLFPAAGTYSVERWAAGRLSVNHLSTSGCRFPFLQLAFVFA